MPVKFFSGIDSPYEVPEAPEVRVSTAGRLPEDCTEDIRRWLSAT